MMILLIFCANVIVVRGFVYAQSEANKQKIINLSLDEIDAMEGHQFEHYTAAMLQFDGFEQVQVTQASGDYGVAVVAYKGGHKWAFQCKRYSKNLGLKPIQEVYAGAKRYGADKAVVFTNVYFTPNAQSLANTLHVELWGRDKLADMIWQRKQEEEAKKEFKESVKQGNRKKEKQKEPSETVSDAPKEPIKEEVSYIEPIKQKETVVPKQENTEPVVKQEPKMESELMQMLYPVSPQEIEKKEVKNMATIIGAGKYVFGENIPMGQYDLKAVSGKGTLKIQIGEGDDFDDKWQNMGYNVKGFAETYSGLTLPKGWFFAIDGDLKCEITKSKMLEIE